MKHKNIDEIKKFESLPKIIKLFSDQEIKTISELYHNSLIISVLCNDTLSDLYQNSLII